MKTEDLKKMFESWGEFSAGTYVDKQWLLSKWEVIEGVIWPPEKIELMISSIIQGLGLSKNDRLADIGCGGGWIMKDLSSQAGEVVGLDFSQAMLKTASKLCPDGRLVCGELGRLPFRDGSFDRALSYFVFLNFTDDDFVENAILDLLRVLKKGGRALIGQLPYQDRSKDYDAAKAEYLAYCVRDFKLGKSHREICRAPQKLFDADKLRDFLKKENCIFEFRDSFNPFYRAGEPKTVDWRFDLILTKP